MFKVSSIFVLVFLFAPPLFAQSVDTAWVRRYNGAGNGFDYAKAIVVDVSGNIYVTGSSYVSGTGIDYATLKYDPAGNQLWVQRYNGPLNSEDAAYAIAVDGSGNVYVTGCSYGSGSTAYDYATLKYDPAGNQLWVQRYNGPGNGIDDARAIAVDDSGNVYVTGSSYGSGISDDYATLKYDPAGNQLWVQRYNGPGNDYDGATSIAVDGSGNVYVTGRSRGFGTGLDYATLKYDPAGNQLWVQRYNGPLNSEDVARAIAVDDSGNVYVTGYSEGSGTGYDCATIKYDPAGNQLWVQRYNGPGNGIDDARAIAVDGSGNVYVTGSSYVSGTGIDYATLKYDPAGNHLWVKKYNGPGGNHDDWATAIAVDGSGNVYVTGYSEGSGTYSDYATLKYDPAGNQLWVQRYNGPGNSNDVATAIAVDDSGNVYVTGNSYGSVTAEDYTTVKYWQNYPPDTFSLVSPSNDTIIYQFPNIITFDWTSAIDPDPWDTVRYDLYISTSLTFHPDSTLVHTNLWTSKETDTLWLGKYFWKVRAYDNHLSTWSNQTWRLNLCMTGDGNCDCRITVSDVVYLINFLFKGGSPPCTLQAGDTNCDRWVTVSDIVYLINYLFKGGPLPCEPQ